MNGSSKIINTVAAGLILGAIVFVYTSISSLSDRIYKLNINFVTEMGLLRSELTQYHTIVGVQQVAIDKLENRVDKLH